MIFVDTLTEIHFLYLQVLENLMPHEMSYNKTEEECWILRIHMLNEIYLFLLKISTFSDAKNKNFC